tara:strand:+ start:1135 stop:1605 length:471 start_codon:yes stop_codon:yes gene_type:complete
MTQTKVIGESVKQTNRTFVKSYTEDYCKALEENYKQQHVASLRRNSEIFSEGRQDLSEYAKEQLREIEEGTAKLMKFRAIEGKKYYKVVSQEYRNGAYTDGSVNTFIDKNTGDVYKAASWKSPAKGVRFTFQKPEHIRFLLNWKNIAWTGGHLYVR